MGKIKIENLLDEREIKAEEMTKVFGGGSTLPLPDFWQPYGSKASFYGLDDPCFLERFPNVP